MCTETRNAGVAQQAERILGKDEVGGSNPLISSKKKSPQGGDFSFWMLHQNGHIIDGWIVGKDNSSYIAKVVTPKKWNVFAFHFGAQKAIRKKRLFHR